MKRFWLCLPLLLISTAAFAQIPAAPAAGDPVEVDPIRCWWRTSAGAIRVGQIFDLSLTCAVLENDAVQVLPDESRLGVAAISLAPFEVVSGSHPADLHSGGRRFFQYQYKVRIINKDAIGNDAGLPPLAIHYTIKNQVTNQAAVQGRDLVYILPSDLIRVASMVPSDARDIRDATGEDFGNVEAFLFRANVLEIVATTSAALGVLAVALTLVALARSARKRVPAGERTLDTRQLVNAAVQELNRVGKNREQHGWNETLAGRALAATRVAASAAMGAAVSQRIATAKSTATDGRLIASGGFRSPSRVISGSATTYDMTRALKSTDADAAQAPLLESLRDAMAAFGALQYGRDGAIDQSGLDGALASAQSAAAQVRAEHSWLKTWLRGWRSNSQTPAVSGA